jgi:hypothetical protein
MLLSRHIPRNARGIDYNIFDGIPKTNMLGFRFDPNPFEGKVVVTTNDAIIVKTGRTKFAVLDRTLVTDIPAEGANVSVQPYARRRFDGQRADTPEREVVNRPDGTSYISERMILGAAPAPLPVPPVKCFELQQLIEQLETMPAPDRHRTITHMLVDAHARDFAVVDPDPSDIITTPPTLSFTVSTEMFAGRVSVIYMRGMDVYAVEFHRDDERVERVDDVYFDMLGEVLARRIDDGAWRRIHVQTLTGGKSKPH